jgi:hypothetical protein
MRILTVAAIERRFSICGLKTKQGNKSRGEATMRSGVSDMWRQDGTGQGQGQGKGVDGNDERRREELAIWFSLGIFFFFGFYFYFYLFCFLLDS